LYGTPKGPQRKRSNPFWNPLHPRKSERPIEKLSPEARAKQLANKENPIPCLPPTHEELEAFRLKLLANGKPVSDNQQQCDGLSYTVESADELQFGYTFGKSYYNPAVCSVDTVCSYDDVAEKRQTLAILNARLSPQTRQVANMVVQTDETDTLAQNYVDVGRAVTAGRRTVSERTLMRHGQDAVSKAAKEISTVLQELAA
jgi:hypothetical protein